MAYVKTVADSYEQVGHPVDTSQFAAPASWTGQPLATGSAGIQVGNRDLNAEIIKGQIDNENLVKSQNAQQLDASTRQAAENKADIERLRRDVAQKESNAAFAKNVGRATSLGAAGVAVLAGQPYLAAGAGLLGDAAETTVKYNLDHPPIPQQDMTGMNGQDFEGITVRE